MCMKTHLDTISADELVTAETPWWYNYNIGDVYRSNCRFNVELTESSIIIIIIISGTGLRADSGRRQEVSVYA